MSAEDQNRSPSDALLEAVAGHFADFLWRMGDETYAGRVRAALERWRRDSDVGEGAEKEGGTWQFRAGAATQMTVENIEKSIRAGGVVYEGTVGPKSPSEVVGRAVRPGDGDRIPSIPGRAYRLMQRIVDPDVRRMVGEDRWRSVVEKWIENEMLAALADERRRPDDPWGPGEFVYVPAGGSLAWKDCIKARGDIELTEHAVVGGKTLGPGRWRVERVG